MDHQPWIRVFTALCVLFVSQWIAPVWAGDAVQCNKLYLAEQYIEALPVCGAEAEQGDAIAQFNLGLMYEYGQAVKKDNTKALKWYRKAAEQGYMEAQFSLGIIYSLGLKDGTKAVKWYRKAAEQGKNQAQFNLGEMYASGEVVKRDYAKAAKWYYKIAEQGDLIAQRKLGDIYSKQHDYPKAVKWYRKAANRGQALAQFQLGLMYANGQGVKRDYTETARWLLKAAKEGYTKAQVFLGYMYERGIKKKGHGIKQDYPKAIKWYRKAAEKGSLMAQTHLSLLYVKNKNYAESLNWYHRAIALKSDQAIGSYRELAKQGNAEAQFYMAKMYGDGEGVKRDYVKAVKWFRRAAEQGIARAQFNLGEMYANGRGVMQSGAAAADWYYKAGLSYLKENNRDDALQSVERIKSLKTVLHLAVPNAFLANQLLARIYGGSGTAQVAPKAKKKKAASVVSGTGWPVVGGYVVTNHHVVAGHHHIVLVRRDGVKIKVTVIADDATNDLALLKPASSKNLPPALPLTNRPAQVGEQVFTVGYPHPDLMGVEAKLTRGIVNARTGIGNDPRVYQISVPLQGGNSGGPLINMRGEVVGVVASKLSAAKVFKWTGDMPQNVNYAIKSGYVQILLSSIDPSFSVSVLPSKKDNLAGLAKRIEGSVLMVIAQ